MRTWFLSPNFTVSVVTVCLTATAQSNPPLPVEQKPAVRLAGSVLSSAISKSKSLQRTNSLLEYPKNKRRLQLALVIDGTETMGDDILSLTEHLQGLVTSLENAGAVPRPGSVGAAIVVFRDTEAPAGPVSVHIDRFTNDLNKIKQELQSIKPQTGRPYFRERVDEGLHAALSRLDWAPAGDDSAERWIIFCGDAPAYPNDSEFRKYPDEDLVKLAVEKKVRICFVLCSSGTFTAALDSEKLKNAVEKERPDLVKFAAEMARKTGGTVLDTAMLQSADFWCDGKVVLDPITERDIQEARNQKSPGSQEGEAVRIAILPHLPLEKMKFSPASLDEVLVARQMNEALKKVPGVAVKTADSVEREFARVIGETPAATLQSPKGQSALISSLARRLNADFVIWGDSKKDAKILSLKSRLYRERDGRIVASSPPQDTDRTSEDAIRDLPSVILRRLCRKAATELRKGNAQTDPAVLAVFERVNVDEQTARSMVTPLARDRRAQKAMLIGLEHLERSLQVAKQFPGAATDFDDQAASQDLRTSVAQFQQALEFEPKNPLACLLLASCYFNLGQQQDLDDWTRMRNTYLEKAYEFRELLEKDDPARTEIQAEYALLVQKDYASAVELYSRLVQDKSQTGGRFGLRARWMLAGIQLGDWGAISYAPNVLNAADARQNIITILANWPDSPEAHFYQASQGKTNVSIGNTPLAMSR